MNKLQDEAQRRRAVAWALALATDTPLAPQHYEQQLLEQYAQGQLTLAAVLARLDQRVQHVLYRSQAVAPFSDQQLAELVEQSKAWNEAHDITGLLCYSAGHFVQLLEGPSQPVLALYDRIRQDQRHHQVTLLSEATQFMRLFTDWRLALVEAEPLEFHWLTSQLDARFSHASPAYVSITEPHLLTLLHAFSKA
ncbi:BLUF domain-containing protein [Hymenobacter sp.]|jgi:hypothetical protein|uniref:BLUF domain-containing protein n=1 Tax=Hymenobacter sp. TaxID=1898978 RepID=UPI002ED9CC78